MMGYVLQHRLHLLSETTYKASALRNATLIESLTAIETIKSQGAESVIQAKWERANEFLAKTNVKTRALTSKANYNHQHDLAAGVGVDDPDRRVPHRQKELTMARSSPPTCCRRGRLRRPVRSSLADAVPKRAHGDGLAQQDHGQAGRTPRGRDLHPAPATARRHRVSQRQSSATRTGRTLRSKA